MVKTTRSRASLATWDYPNNYDDLVDDF